MSSNSVSEPLLLLGRVLRKVDGGRCMKPELNDETSAENEVLEGHSKEQCRVGIPTTILAKVFLKPP